MLPENRSTLYFKELHGTEPLRLEEKMDASYHPLTQIIEDVFDEPESHFVAFNIYGVSDLHLMYCAKPSADGRHAVSAARVEDQEEAGHGLRNIMSVLRTVAPGSTFMKIEHGEGDDKDGQPVKCGGCHVDHTHPMLVRIAWDYFEHVHSSLRGELSALGWDVENKRVLHDFYTLKELTKEERKLPYLDIGVSRPDGTTEHIVYLQKGNAAQSPRSQILLELMGYFEYDKSKQQKYGRLLTNWSEVHDLAMWGDPIARELGEEAFADMLHWRQLLTESKKQSSGYTFGQEGFFLPNKLLALECNTAADWAYHTNSFDLNSIKTIASAALRPIETRINIVKDIEAETRILYANLPINVRQQSEKTALLLLLPDGALPALISGIVENLYLNEACPYYKDKLFLREHGQYKYTNRWERKAVEIDELYDETRDFIYEILDIEVT